MRTLVAGGAGFIGPPPLGRKRHAVLNVDALSCAVGLRTVKACEDAADKGFVQADRIDRDVVNRAVVHFWPDPFLRTSTDEVCGSFGE